MAAVIKGVVRNLARGAAYGSLYKHWVGPRDGTHRGTIPAGKTGTQYTPGKDGYYKVTKHSPPKAGS